MNGDAMDRVINDWISDGPDRGPAHALERALAATRRVDQRPGWLFPGRWLPRPVAELHARVPRTVTVALLLLLLLIALMVVAVPFAGAPPRIRTLLGASADRLVAFQDGPSIAVTRVGGSAVRTISGAVPYARSPSFSPDGSHVAFVGSPAPDGRDGRLVVVPIVGSGPAVELSRVDVRATNLTSLAWSPDGTHIAFAGDDGGASRIFIAASDGSGAAPITDGTTDRDLPTWSPDGSWIAFREKERDGVRTRLRMARPDGSDVQEVAMVVANDGLLSKLRFSPVSTSLSYASNPGFGSRTSAMIDLGAAHVGIPWSDGIGGLTDYGVPWSPDGRYLAILTASDGVVVADDDRTEPYKGTLRRLGPVADCWVDWSPDGTALYGGSPGGCAGTVVIPLSDPSATVTLPMSGSGPASWQPLEP